MNKNKYPWRENNAFTLLKDGDIFFPAIFSRIEHARYFVLIEIYLISSSGTSRLLFDSLRIAKQRGAAIYLLFDAYGARGLSLADRAMLTQLGAQLCFYNRLHVRSPLRYLPRDHRKIISIDGTTTFIGGLGFTNQFRNPSPKKQWRETVVQVEGGVCQDWLDAFREAWENTTDTPLSLPTHADKELSSLTQKGRVVLSPVQNRREIRRSIIHQLRAAKTRIWISTAYFVPSRKIRRLLRRAARRGVDVRLILPGKHIDLPAVRYAGHRFYARLLHNRVKIYEYQPRFIHQKIVLIDDWVSMGSANMDRWNLRWNLEANQEIDDPAFAQQIEHMLKQDLSECIEISYEQWCQRTRWRRFLEWFWGTIDHQLLKLTELRKRHTRTK